MKNILIFAAVAASTLLPAAANAQAVPAATIAVVDLEKVSSECTACKAAAASLRGQATALQSRQQALAGPLQTEQKSIQAAIDALGGKEPDAALKTRASSFQTRYQQAQEEIARSEQQIQRNQAYIKQQLGDKLGPIYQQVMQRRGANVMLEVGATLATSSSVDVTNDVLAALNAALPTIQTTAPAAAATPARKQPQGR